MLTPHFISQWYLQKEPPEMLSRLVKSFPLVEIQVCFFFLVKPFENLFPKEVPFKF